MFILEALPPWGFMNLEEPNIAVIRDINLMFTHSKLTY